MQVAAHNPQSSNATHSKGPQAVLATGLAIETNAIQQERQKVSIVSNNNIIINIINSSLLANSPKMSM